VPTSITTLLIGRAKSAFGSQLTVTASELDHRE
jgi:hypothetical protein